MPFLQRRLTVGALPTGADWGGYWGVRTDLAALARALGRGRRGPRPRTRLVASRSMRAAAEVAAPRLRSLPVTTGALGGGVAALLFWTLFFGGGSRGLSLAWLGTAVVLAASAALAAALLGALPWPDLDRTGLAFLVLTGLFVLWNGASISWSLDPDRAWAYTNRGLVYLAFACLGLFVGALVPRAPRAVAAGLAVLLAGVLGWALLGKVVPSLFPDGGRLARLRSPVGYWNALALLADMAVALGLWLAARPGAPARGRG